MTSHESSCSRRLFLIGTATTFAGALLTACGKNSDSLELPTTDVPVGSAVIVEDIIIAQPVAGEYKAYSTVCPHQGYPINLVEGELVKCNRHNSTFSIKDGAVVSGPARDSLEVLTSSVANETVTVDK